MPNKGRKENGGEGAVRMRNVSLPGRGGTGGTRPLCHMSAPFEERSGVVPCVTPWGRWYQTLEEVFIEVQVPPGTRAKDVCCSLQSRRVALSVCGREVLQVAAGRRGREGRREKSGAEEPRVVVGKVNAAKRSRGPVLCSVMLWALLWCFTSRATESRNRVT